MYNPAISQKITDIQGRLGAVIPVITDPEFNRRNEIPESCDFMFGNPQEMPLPGYAETLQHWATPHNKDWFAYKMNEPQAQEVIAESLRKRQGIAYQPGDVTLTTGAFSALAISLTAVVNPGDEVIFLSPPWFFYETLILGAGGNPVRVKVDAKTFDLDLDAIQAAITDKTRASSSTVLTILPAGFTRRRYWESLHACSLRLKNARSAPSTCSQMNLTIALSSMVTDTPAQPLTIPFHS